MKLLILGGTQFVGRHLVEAALAREHEITLFHRGKTGHDLFPTVERLQGDRDGGLDALRGRCWDAVLDTCGYVPRIVRASAELLADAVDHYTFISSISVFADFNQINDENGELIELEDQTVEVVTGETYGGLKVLCERAAEAVMPGRVLQVRPGLIVGPFDPTDRFTYWVDRIAKGGEVLAPGNPEGAVQFVDGRDLAVWTINLIEAGKTGYYNATGPDYRLTMQKMLETCQEVSGSDSQLTWVDAEFLLERDTFPFRDIPFWMPPDRPGFAAVNCQKAIGDGLTFRPLVETIKDTLDWQLQRTGELKVGLKPEREQALLAEWHERS